MNHKTERDEALAKWQRECEGGSVPVTPMMRHAYRDGWDDALSGQSAGVPTGYALVPIELTPEMVKAGATSGGLGMDFYEWMGRIKIAWRHMIAAAPAPVCQSAGVPIYQVTEDDDAWHDTDWTTYDSASNDSRRIVYAAAPAPVSAPAPDREQATLCEDGGKCGIGGYCGQCEKVRAASDPEQPSERGEQDCPHGVDDGACKQCYGEATRGEQGAALSDAARECLMDVVSHYDNIVAGFAAQRLNACEAGNSDDATYWTREMNVANRMKVQAERALAASAPTLSEEQGTALLHAAADECMSPDQRNLFDSLGAHDADVYERLFRCVAKRIDASAATLSEPEHIDSAEFAALQTYLNAYHKDVRPTRPSGLAAWALAALTSEPSQPQAAEPKQPPFDNCQFRICDLPGQCRAEGKCHHPAAQVAEPKGLTDEQRESKERAEFEAYMTGKGYVCKTHFGGYVAGDVASKWDVWQARALLAPPPQAAEPKRLTEKQRDAIEHAIPVLMDAKQFGDVVTLRALLRKGY